MRSCAWTLLLSATLLGACRSGGTDDKPGPDGTGEPDTGDASTTEEIVDADADADGYAEDVDCDDTNAAIHPDATEICDGIDNNCNDLVDDADDTLSPIDLLTVYTDGDGDGYGLEGTETTRCAADAGFALVQVDAEGAPEWDCDDLLGWVHPGAAEDCGSGLDEDCDGTFGTACGVTALGDGSTVEIDVLGSVALETSAQTAKLLFPVGFDLDGDGTEDLLVGDSSYDNATAPDGVVHVLWGDPDLSWFVAGGGADLLPTSLETALTAEVAATVEAGQIAAQMATLSDATGDGLEDLAFTSAFGVWLVEQGSVTPGTSQSVPDAATGFIWMAEPPYAADVASAGDIDDDGLTELLVMQGRGLGAVLFWGHDLADASLLYPSDGLVIAQKIGGYTCLGFGDLNTATGLDLDGDGYSDLVAGCYANANNLGDVVAMAGSALSAISEDTAGPEDGDLCVRRDAGYQYMGRIVAPAGDLNHDGYPDLAISKEDHDVLILAGGAERLSTTASCGGTPLREEDMEHVVRVTNGNERSISSIFGTVDLTGDGIGDLVAIYEHSASNAGKAQIFAGGEGWDAISTSADFTMQAKNGTFLYQGAAVDLGNTGVPSLVFPSNFGETSIRILTVPGY